MKENWPNFCSNKFTGVSKREINCGTFNAIYWKTNKLHQLVYTETGNQKTTTNSK